MRSPAICVENDISRISVQARRFHAASVIAGPRARNREVRFVSDSVAKVFLDDRNKFSGLWARPSNDRAGTTETRDELTGNFGSALEDASISDYRLIALFAEKTLNAIFGVLQHYLSKN